MGICWQVFFLFFIKVENKRIGQAKAILIWKMAYSWTRKWNILLPQLDFGKFEICPREILLSGFWGTKTNKILVKLPNFELENQKEYARYEKSMPIPRAISNNLSISIKNLCLVTFNFFISFIFCRFWSNLIHSVLVRPYISLYILKILKNFKLRFCECYMSRSLFCSNNTCFPFSDKSNDQKSKIELQIQKIGFSSG